MEVSKKQSDGCIWISLSIQRARGWSLALEIFFSSGIQEPLFTAFNVNIAYLDLGYLHLDIQNVMER